MNFKITFSLKILSFFSSTGIVFTDGEVWREHRRFTLTCLRDFGMGKVSLEAKIHEEASYLLAEVATENGRPFDVRKHLPKAVSNIICSIIYGSRFDYNDEVFKVNICIFILKESYCIFMYLCFARGF